LLGEGALARLARTKQQYLMLHIEQEASCTGHARVR